MRSYIWPLPNRIAHALMGALFLLCFISGQSEAFIFFHALLGVALAWVVIFRIIWGFGGPRYSKFKDFDLDMGNLKEYMLHIYKPHNHAGHNPASSWSAIGLLVLLGLSAASGAIVFFAPSHLAKELHEIIVYVTLILIGLHVAGAILSAKVNGVVALTSMVNGFKNTTEQIKISKAQKIGGALGMLGVVGAICGSAYGYNAFLESQKATSLAKLPSNYVKECTSCHSLYPSEYLSKASWKEVMDGLDTHFGTDASLDEAVSGEIGAFLQTNAGPNPKSKFSKKSAVEDGIEITKTKVWKKKHEDIPKEIFAKKEFRASNCIACHTDANSGMINPANISFNKLSSSEKIKLYGALLCD